MVEDGEVAQDVGASAEARGHRQGVSASSWQRRLETRELTERLVITGGLANQA